MEQVLENVFKVKVPVPFPLEFVNCYVFKGREGWSVVDTGINYPPARAAWEAAFDYLGLCPRDIRAIYVTHFHPDHYGLAGWLQEQSGAPVFMSETDARAADMVWKSDERWRETIKFMALNGVPADLVDRMTEITVSTKNMVLPYPNLAFISEGQEVVLGEVLYRVVITPGHTDGHVCLYNQREGVLLSGDHLLPKITSNIGRWPGAAANPLSNFLKSLEQVAELDARLVLPAHGPVFTSAKERVKELLRHHKERLASVMAAVGSGASVYEVCAKVFGSDLSPSDWRFALTETVAHLDYLRAKGALETVPQEVVIYRPKSGQVG